MRSGARQRNEKESQRTESNSSLTKLILPNREIWNLQNRGE